MTIRKIKVDDHFSLIKQSFIDLNIDITNKTVREVESELDNELMKNIVIALNQLPIIKNQTVKDKILENDKSHNIIILKAHIKSLKWWLEQNSNI